MKEFVEMWDKIEDACRVLILEKSKDQLTEREYDRVI